MAKSCAMVERNVVIQNVIIQNLGVGKAAPNQ